MEIIKDVSKFITVEMKNTKINGNRDIVASINFSLSKMLVAISPLFAEPVLTFLLYFL